MKTTSASTCTSTTSSQASAGAAAFATTHKAATKVIPATGAQGPHPRLTLNQATRAHLGMSFRKRPANSTAITSHAAPTLAGLLGRSTCNSGFLSSLLADVAKAKDDIIQAKRAAGSKCVATSSMGDASPLKRRRISVLTDSPSSLSASRSSNAAVDANVYRSTTQTNKALSAAALKEPAHFLDLLWEESWLAPPLLPLSVRSSLAARAPLLPRQQAAPVFGEASLPATVSDFFEGYLQEDDSAQERALVLSSSSSASDDSGSSSKEESFGWFVAADEDDDDDARMCDYYHRSACHYSAAASAASTDPYYKERRSSGCLAFSPSTAPNGSNHAAEVEWAKAADTVDDVLGDLF